MTPEEKSREQIDRQLAACGWLVQDHKSMNIMAGPGVAVREFPLKTGYGDYLLYVDGNLDIFWLKDKSLEDSENLPEPDVLAQEIADDLQAALDQFSAIAAELKR